MFKLTDTYGLPLEIIVPWLKKHKFFPDGTMDLYNEKLQEQRERSKAKSTMKGNVFDTKSLGVKLKETKFVGYKDTSAKAKILAILKEGKEVDEISSADVLQIVLDQTPFYAESGGQVGDVGELTEGKNVFEVLDTKKIDNVVLHTGRAKSGNFKKADTLVAKINVQRRLNISRNHTATHILQASLREVLGNHVQQQGSLVSEEKLRFDFTHFKGLSEEEIARVEEVANNYIIKNYTVDSKEMALKDAKKAGALAFFEEKYGENVRVVEIGNISKELCGGTHLTNIKQIGLIKIISESSVASGIRRIEAVTAEFAEQFIKDQEQKAIEESKKRGRLEELKAREKKLSAEINSILSARSLELSEKSVTINGIKAVFSVEDNLDMNALRLLVDMIKGKLSQAVIVLGSQDGGRASLVIGLTTDLCAKGLSAKNIILQVAPLIGGSGGGRDDFAQAGGNLPDNFKLAFDKIKDIIIKL